MEIITESDHSITVDLPVNRNWGALVKDAICAYDLSFYGRYQITRFLCSLAKPVSPLTSLTDEQREQQLPMVISLLKNAATALDPGKPLRLRLTKGVDIVSYREFHQDSVLSYHTATLGFTNRGAAERCFLMLLPEVDLKGRDEQIEATLQALGMMELTYLQKIKQLLPCVKLNRRKELMEPYSSEAIIDKMIKKTTQAKAQKTP